MSGPADEQRGQLEERVMALLGQLCVELSRDMGRATRRRLPVDDVVQETAARALANLANFRGGNDAVLAVWLRAIARNYVRSTIYRPCPVPRQSLAEALYASGALRPSQEVALAEEIALLEQHVGQLDPNHQRMLQLRYVEGLSFAEIGERLGQPDGIVRGWHRNALHRLAGR